MYPAGKFAAKARIVELPSVGLRDERRQALALRQFLSERGGGAFRCGGRLETRDERGWEVFIDKWPAIGGAHCDGAEELGEIPKNRSGRGKNNARDDVRIGTLREGGDLDRHSEISERNPQIEERRTTTNDEFAIKWIDICEATGTIGTNEQLITIDDELPRLSVVARGRKDRVSDGKARLVCS